MNTKLIEIIEEYKDAVAATAASLAAVVLLISYDGVWWAAFVLLIVVGGAWGYDRWLQMAGGHWYDRLLSDSTKEGVAIEADEEYQVDTAIITLTANEVTEALETLGAPQAPPEAEYDEDDDEDDDEEDEGVVAALISRETYHMLICGGSKVGKTALARHYFARLMADKPDAEFVILDPHSAPSEWPSSFQRVPITRSREAYADYLESLIEEMNDRYEARTAGESQAPREIHVYVGEWHAFVNSRTIDKKIRERGIAALEILTVESGKAAIHLIVDTHSPSAASLGWSGRGDIRESFTICQITKQGKRRTYEVDDIVRGDCGPFDGWPAPPTPPSLADRVREILRDSEGDTEEAEKQLLRVITGRFNLEIESIQPHSNLNSAAVIEEEAIQSCGSDSLMNGSDSLMNGSDSLLNGSDSLMKKELNHSDSLLNESPKKKGGGDSKPQSGGLEIESPRGSDSPLNGSDSLVKGDSDSLLKEADEADEADDILDLLDALGEEYDLIIRLSKAAGAGENNKALGKIFSNRSSTKEKRKARQRIINYVRSIS